MKEQVDAYLAMPAKYTTIVARAELAQQFCELARDQTRMCESLVHDQHLQQQGWAAAVANLEDITTAFQAKSEIFDQSYKQHLETREENLKILKKYVIINCSRCMCPDVCAQDIASQSTPNQYNSGTRNIEQLVFLKTTEHLFFSVLAKI